MLAPLTTSLETKTGGLTSNLSRQRTAVLTDRNDPLSLTTLTETVTVNGRTGTTVYDAANKTFTATSPAGRRIKTVIDSLGRLSRSETPSIAPIDFTYDAQGRPATIAQGSGTDERLASLAYNPQGYLDSVTDPLGRQVKYEYDLAGRVTRQTLPDSRAIEYAYDANGNLSSLKPPGRELHFFNYTAVDLVEDYTPPDAGTGLNVTRYQYNLDRNLTLITRPDGQTVSVDYTAPGKKLSAITMPTGTYACTYKPATGQLDTLTAPGGQDLVYTYDGFLLKSETATGTVSGTISYTYDKNFWVTSQSVNGSAINFAYDNDGLLTGAGSETLTRHTDNGLLTATTLSNVTTAHGYSNFGELFSESASVNASPVYQASYPVRDKLGRIKERTETLGGVTSNFEYSYDLAGRLDTVTKDGNPVSTYTYDPNGNRLSHNDISATYDGQDRLLTYGAASYAYTANGELLSKTVGTDTTSYSYDVLGNLLAVTLPDGTSLEYVTDGGNRRVGKKVDGTLVQGFVYQDQIEPVAELDGRGNVVSRFVYASKAHVPDYLVRSGQTYRIVSDHLSSPRLVINTNDGSVAQRLDYDEFGKVLLDTNPGFQPFGFAGGIYDPHTKLTRFGARDYDAATGRWTAKDPIGFRGGDTNLYGYVVSDPVNLSDPTGLSSIIYSGGAGVGTGSTIPIYNGSGQAVGTFPASNNAASSSNGPWPVGTFPYGQYNPHSGAGPDSQYGSNGNFMFQVPNRRVLRK